MTRGIPCDGAPNLSWPKSFRENLKIGRQTDFQLFGGGKKKFILRILGVTPQQQSPKV